MELNADNVSTVFLDCMYRNNELDTKGKPKVEPVVVAGIIHNFGLHPDRLHGHVRHVRTMLLELPKEFFLATGGGWSFLNLCQRADGVQWTGLHQTQEQLCVLAIGLGMASWVPDQRELWQAMPGGMPYFQINLNEEPSGD